MRETINENYWRVDLFWELIATHFLCISNSKHNELRLFSIEVLNNIVEGAFQFFLGYYKYRSQLGVGSPV